jgi:hypothetical protein
MKNLIESKQGATGVSAIEKRTFPKWLLTIIGGAGIILANGGCAKTTTFSLLPDQNTFAQNSNSTLTSKMDILWVIDNSGSMASSQQAIMDNFQRFIEKFTAKGYDFRMAVTTTEAYKELYGSGADISKFRDGQTWAGFTGVYVIDQNTPNILDTALINLKQGVWGSGDERAFQSFKQALSNPFNAGFPRSDAFFSIIIVSDEDDFSHNGSNAIANYTDATLYSVQSYVDYLDQLTQATSATRAQKYNVNSIAVLDADCKAQLDSQIAGRRIGVRYMDISSRTGGITGSLCGDFGSTLANISTKIIELSTQFYLNRIPIPETIMVIVDGITILSDALNGYVYHADTNSITFHGNAIPASGAKIAVNFDPVTLR